MVDTPKNEGEKTRCVNNNRWSVVIVLLKAPARYPERRPQRGSRSLRGGYGASRRSWLLCIIPTRTVLDRNLDHKNSPQKQRHGPGTRPAVGVASKLRSRQGRQLPIELQFARLDDVVQVHSFLFVEPCGGRANRTHTYKVSEKRPTQGTRGRLYKNTHTHTHTHTQTDKQKRKKKCACYGFSRDANTA